jgi:hypothetical protein
VIPSGTSPLATVALLLPNGSLARNTEKNVTILACRSVVPLSTQRGHHTHTTQAAKQGPKRMEEKDEPQKRRKRWGGREGVCMAGCPCPVLSRPRPRVLVLAGVPPCPMPVPSASPSPLATPPIKSRAGEMERLSAAAGRRALVTGNFCFSVSVAVGRWRRGRAVVARGVRAAGFDGVGSKSGQRKGRKGWAFLVIAWLWTVGVSACATEVLLIGV